MACVGQCTSVHSSEVERFTYQDAWIPHHVIKLGVNSLHMIYPGLLGTHFSNFSQCTINHIMTCPTLALSLASRVSAHIPLYMVKTGNLCCLVIIHNITIATWITFCVRTSILKAGIRTGTGSIE